MKRVSCWGSVLAAMFVMVSIAGGQAQPPGGRGGPGGLGGFGFGGDLSGGTLGMLLRADVRKELELLDSQVDELNELREAMTSQLRELMAAGENLSREERMQRGREVLEKARNDAEEKVTKVLLPHQLRRLEQLNEQNQLRMRGGMMRGLTGDQIAEELGIDEAQREKIRAKAEKLEAELRQKMAELRAKAQDELLNELTPAQQAKVKERFGEPFEFQREELQLPQFGRGGQGSPNGGEQPGRGPRGARPQR